jgi:hypothetical protein
MKKISNLVIILALFLLVSGCSGKTAGNTGAAASGAGTQAAEPVASEAPALKGEVHKADKFSITVPKGWEVMDVEGGVQLYKMSGEIIEVHYRGSNQTEDSAKQQAESNASLYSGTTPQEVELLGKKFWATTFTASGVKQTSYLRIEDGVMLSIKCAGPNFETSSEFKAILDSIVFS